MSGIKIAEDILIGMFGFVLCVEACAKIVEHKENKENIIIDGENETLIIKCNTNEIPYENFKVYTRVENKKLHLYIKGATVSDDMVIKGVSHKYRIKHIAPQDFKNLSWEIDDKNKLKVKISINGYADKISVKKVK